MTKYRIKIYSKKKESLKHFLKFIKQLQNYQIISNFIRKKKKLKKITVLKSPHVNKKAQEQFQFVTYFNEFTYFTWDKKKGTLFLKKIKDNVFPGVNISIEQLQSINKKVLTIKSILLNPLKFTETKINFPLKRSQRNKKLFSEKRALQKKELPKKTLISLKRLENYNY